ncbi:hypothetical protein H4S14_000293 [Agrobacterium vitis]|nr:hypothetical protein [Agrobacterium vitis]MBE1436566.1 hypothetical protein [Agrobacterium vitis]
MADKPEFISPPDGEKYSAELRGMIDRSFIASDRHKGQHNRADRSRVHPEIVEFERVFIKRMAKLGVPMFAHCVYRSDTEQQRLYVRGNSRAKPGQSPHAYGFAVDLVHGTKAWDLTRKQWDLVGHVGKEVAASLGLHVVWGGDWSFYDPAHWELAGWRSLPRSI